MSDDPLSHAWWAKEFGSVKAVPWAKFNESVAKYLKSVDFTLSSEDGPLLRAIFDQNRSGFVEQTTLASVLKLFGPLKTCMPMARKVLQERWFYGWMAEQDALLLLRGQPLGTYLVTMSAQNHGCMSLFFVHSSGVLAIRVLGCMPADGLQVGEEGGRTRIFENIYDLISFYSRCLSNPFTAAVSKEKWFHGDCNEADCTRLLEGLREGSYLVRFGETGDEYFCSYVADNGVLHIPVRLQQGGLSAQERRANAFCSVLRFIQANRAVLRYEYDPEGVPLSKIVPLENAVVIDSLYGPTEPNQPIAVGNACGYGRAVSLYPKLVSATIYQLICDRFVYEVFSNWHLMAVADGCGLGDRSQEAAWRAGQGFADYMREQWQRMHDLKEVGHALLRGFQTAHKAILTGHADILEAGTTTLLGGVLLHLDKSDCHGDYKYAFVCASVGDCKAFVWSPKTKQAADVTARNRGGINPTDPGGRLGPYLDGGAPDVRNLKVYFELCAEGDIVFIVTDGVHDNFDPRSLGKTPADIGLGPDNWEDLSVLAAEKAKQKYMCQLLSKLLYNCTTPQQVCDRIIDYCTQLTQPCRTFMEQNPRAKQPSDYAKYPGKPDHTTILAVVVGLSAAAPGASAAV